MPLFGLTKMPAIWAQAAGTSVNSPALLALRRWCSSLTLSSPEAVPSRYGLWSWLLGIFGLVILASIMQGPLQTFRQLVDFPSQFRFFSAIWRRLLVSTRVLAATIGGTVLAWTASQMRTFSASQGRDDLVLLMKSRSLRELAAEQGVFTTLIPYRDVFSLGDNLPLLLIATIVLFRAVADRWSDPYVPPHLARHRLSPFNYAACGAGALYLLYRLACLATGLGDLPIGGCMMLEIVIVPALMLAVDATLLSWLLVELRNAGLGDRGEETFDPQQSVSLLPGSMLACFAAVPARYIATSVLLVWLSAPTSAGTTALGRYTRWQLSWGLADLQGVALITAGLAGSVAWSRGSWRGAIQGYLRLLAQEGGRLTALLAWSGLAAGFLSSLAYLLLLSMPTQTWVLAAADSYSHYATLPIGLFCLAGFVELGERSLPVATPASEPEPSTS